MAGTLRSTSSRRDSVCGGSCGSDAAGCGLSAIGSNHFSHRAIVRSSGDICRDGENGVRRVVETAVEIAHFVERGSGDVIGRKSDRRPPVGMHAVGQGPQQHRHIAVGLVEVSLFILLDDNPFLGFEVFLRDVESRHAVAFEPEGRFDVVLGQGDVKVRVVVVGEGVVLPAGHLYRCIEVGNRLRAPEHEMFEQVGEARAGGILVAGPDLVEQVYGGQFGRAVAVHDDRQPVRKRMFLVVDHVVANFFKGTILFAKSVLRNGMAVSPCF